jgi:hypothetical protein
VNSSEHCCSGERCSCPLGSCVTSIAGPNGGCATVREMKEGCPCSKINLARLGGRDGPVLPHLSYAAPTLIAMMQATNLRGGNNVSACEG